LFEAATRTGDQAVITKEGSLAQDGVINKNIGSAVQWLDDLHAPVWKRISKATPYQDFFEAASHHWGTSWLDQFLRLVKIGSADTTNFRISAISLQQGGPFAPHNAHQVGREFDVDDAGPTTILDKPERKKRLFFRWYNQEPANSWLDGKVYGVYQNSNGQTSD